MTLNEMQLYYRLFLACGLWYPVPNDFIGKVAFIAQFIRNLLFFVGWFVCLTSIYYEGFRASMRGTAFFIVIGFLTNVSHIIFYFKRYDTHIIMKMIKMSFNSHQKMWEKKFIQNRASSTFKLVKIYILMMLLISVILYMLLPILNVFLEYFDIHTLNLPLPFRGFSLGKLRKDNIDRLLEFIGLAWCYLGIAYYVSIQSEFYFFTHYVAAEIELICEKIRRLSFINEERNFLTDKVTNSPPDRVTLRDIILHHQLGREVINYFGLPFAVQNNVGALSLCMTLIAASSELHKDSSVVLVSVMISFCMIVQLLSVCYFGNYLVEQSNMIHKRLYDLPWYRLTPPARKGLLMIFMEAVNPIVINYRGVAPINLRTFMQAINAAYSYFTLLKSTIDE